LQVTCTGQSAHLCVCPVRWWWARQSCSTSSLCATLYFSTCSDYGNAPADSGGGSKATRDSGSAHHHVAAPSGRSVRISTTVLCTVQPSQDYLSPGAEDGDGYPSDDNSLRSSTYMDTEAQDECPYPAKPDADIVRDAPVCREAGSPRLETRLETVVKVGSNSPCERRASLEVQGDVRPEVESGGVPIRIFHPSDILLEKKPPDKSFDNAGNEPSAKVTFLIGDSMSPESDMESRQQTLEQEIKKHKKLLKDNQQKQCNVEAKLQVDQNKTNDSKTVSSASSFTRKTSQWCPRTQGDCVDMFDEYFNDDNPVETRTIDDVNHTGMKGVGKDAPNLQGCQVRVHGQTCERLDKDGSKCDAGDGSAEQDKGIEMSLSVPSQDIVGEKKKAVPLNDWEIPRNESSDSALGDSESEDAGQELPRQDPDGPFYSDDQADWQDELEVPLPGILNLQKLVENYSKPSIANFGRSLFGGYCPTYVPDFVLHGAPNDEKLRQNLVSDLAHAVQHPVLDEPIAEAVCIIADTDKWSVQVASSQRRPSDKLGQEVLVSNLVSNLLQSTYQLYRLNLSPNFCIMHLEDRLQELYFKSKMLAEYLKGQTRVHVKELGMVLGIESNDLPLLAAIASTLAVRGPDSPVGHMESTRDSIPPPADGLGPPGSVRLDGAPRSPLRLPEQGGR
ncbi:hypothetical protein cypCar_00003894, partial [Cyprinus carpio]